jgi:hypothetical protein
MKDKQRETAIWPHKTKSAAENATLFMTPRVDGA